MRLRGESGFTLTEVLVAMGLMIVILSATLTILDSFVTTNERNVRLNEMRETARVSIDRLARELRNAGAQAGQQSPVERAGPRDLVFNDVNPAAGGGAGTAGVRRVRYCLEEPTPTTGRLWRQEQPRTVAALPVILTCPDAAYGSQKLVADGIVNHAVLRDGTNPAVFSYDQPSDLAQLTSIGTELFVDTDVDRDPATTDLSTSVRIRNRNRAPNADFSATPQGNRHVLLNAGASSDPEGQQLNYDWSCTGSCPGLDSFDGYQVVDFKTPLTGNISRTFRLQVTDPGGLTSPRVSRTVDVP